MLIRGVSAGLMFVGSVVLGRALGVAQYGLFTAIVSWVALLSVPALLGLDLLAIRELPALRLRGGRRMAGGFLLFVSGTTAVTAFAVCTTAVVTVLLVVDDRGTATAAATGLPLLLLLVALRLVERVSQAVGVVVRSQLPQFVVMPLLMLAGVLLLLALGRDLDTLDVLVVRYAAMGGATMCAGWVLWKAMTPLRSSKEAWLRSLKDAWRAVVSVDPGDRRTRRAWLSSGVVLALMSGSKIINERLSVVILSLLDGPEAAGLFDAARVVSASITFFLTAANVAVAPTIAELHARGESEQLERVLSSLAGVSLVVGMTLLLPLTIFAGAILRLFGPDFVGGVLALRVLLVGQVVSAGVGSVALLLNMAGYERETARTFGMALGASVCLHIACVPVLGPVGAALATAVTTAAWNLWLLIVVRDKLNLRVWPRLGELGMLFRQ